MKDLQLAESYLGEAERLLGVDSEREVLLRKYRAGELTPIFQPELADEHRALSSYIRHGPEKMDREDLDILNRAQAIGSDGAGGYAVDSSVFPEVVQGLLSYGGVLAGPINRIETENGNELKIPSTDDTGNGGTLLAENTQDSEVAITFTQASVAAFKFTSGIVLSSNEWLMDNAVNGDRLILRMLGERLGRGLAPYLVNGDGVAEPQGLLASTNSVTAASASAITRDDLLGCIYGVDALHRNSDAFRIIVSDSTMLAIRKLDHGTSDAAPIYQPSAMAGEPGTIEGVPVIVDPAMEAIGGGLHSVICADLSRLWLRQAGPIRLIRAVERWIDYDQTGFLGFARWDSAWVDPKNNAACVLRHPAS
jgi:HK97 family phage major capsid protein